MKKIDMTFEILFEDESVKMLELYKMSSDEIINLNTSVFISSTEVPNKDTEKFLKEEVEEIKEHLECNKQKLVALYKFIYIKDGKKTMMFKAIGKNK